MKRPTRQADGTYNIAGKSYPELFGSRAQVIHGTAYKTTGGLTKEDLCMNRAGRIVSCKKQKTAKGNKNPLRKLGLLQRKGSKKFGPRKTMKRRK